MTTGQLIVSMSMSMLTLTASTAAAEASAAAPPPATVSAARQISLGVEAVGGVMLFASDNPFSFGLQPGESFGACFDVNFGQVLPVGPWALEPMAELRWQYSRSARGTQSFSVEAHHQALSLAPGLALRMGADSPWLLFGQVGAGADVITVTAAAAETNSQSMAGIQGLVQYGGGVRFAPKVAGAVGLALRLEVMRVHRDLQGDTWVGAGAGVSF